MGSDLATILQSIRDESNRLAERTPSIYTKKTAASKEIPVESMSSYLGFGSPLADLQTLTHSNRGGGTVGTGLLNTEVSGKTPTLGHVPGPEKIVSKSKGDSSPAGEASEADMVFTLEEVENSPDMSFSLAEAEGYSDSRASQVPELGLREFLGLGPMFHFQNFKRF